MEIPKKIKSEIENFCKLNKIKSVDKFILKTLETGFNVEKYGNAPWKTEVEKEIPVEVIKEVIVEKEIIKEVIKEVEIIKEVFVTDDEKVNVLIGKLNELNGKITQSEIDIKEKNETIKTLSEKLTKTKKQIKNLDDIGTKEPPPDDFYDDDNGKGGWWGSNLLNRK